MLISEFYNNQVVFLTGGTGFIGKALIEKLLRSCPGISKMYVLIRTKEAKTAQERLNSTLKDPAFKLLWRDRPEVFKKIQAIEGDCCKLNLEIAPDDLERINDVTIIIHSAATVRFDEPLRQAIFLNTRSTHELIKIAMNLRKLISFVHISTTYSNLAEYNVYEKVYEPSFDWRVAIKIAEKFDGVTLDILMRKIRNIHPNTYTFTKNLSEQVVKEFKDKLPIAIFRPSIITSSLYEPLPGWTDNVNGPTGVFVACGTGLKRSELCRADTMLAIVPIDIVVRGIILLAFKTAMEKSNESDKTKTEKDIDVINCALDKTAPLTLGKMMRTGEKVVKLIPFEKAAWVPGGCMHEIKIFYLLQLFLQQLPFSLLLDGLLILNRRKPIAIKLQRIFANASQALQYFMFNDWNFKTDKFLSLENLVSPEEKQEFGFLSLCFINYYNYYTNMIYGMREFLLNEPKYPTSAALKRMKFFTVINYIIQGIVVYIGLRFVYQKASLLVRI